MKKSFFAAAAFSALFAFAGGAFAQAGDGWLSRYWDGCKPSCSWSGKQYNGAGQCKECDKSNNKMNTSDGNRSSCDGGNSYTCWDMSPWAVDNTTAYGYAAAHRDNQCGTCWELTFKGTTEHAGNGDASVLRNKKLIVMISNIGDDVQGNQLDFLVPGGGVGQFDSFSSQIGVSSSALGERYGGLLSAGCQGNPTCLKGKCDNVFGKSGQEWLKSGCYFYAEWMGAIGNPQYNAKSVNCPDALVNRWKNAATGNPPNGGNPGGGNPTPTPTMYTVTVTKSHDGAGTTTPASTQSVESGKSLNLSTTVNSGYTFSNWTVTSGTANITNANSATGASVTVNGNITVRANFTQNASTYTLTVDRNPTAGGTTNPASSQSNINAGTQVNISATAAAGYTFNNWTITSGSGNINNANSASTQITVNGNVTVRANFTQNQTNYTLTVNRNPAAGGSVTVNNQSNPASVTVTGGTSVNISAAAASGYTFTNWTVTSGTAQINNANSASTSVSISSNATISANFTQNPTAPTQYTLTVSRLPDNNAGTVKVNNQNYTDAVKLDGGKAADIVATPAANYKFTSWTVSYGNASIANANNATTTVTLTQDALIVANFTSTAVTPPSGGGNRTDTTKIEAEDYTSKNGNNIREGNIEDAGGGMCIGYIEGGNSTTYNNVTVARSGVYTMQFRIANSGQTNFTVTVNGNNVGTISAPATGGWNDYVIVSLPNDVQLSAGSNTVTLNFQGSVNVDYFLLLGEPGSATPVRYRASTEAAPRMNIAVRADAKGFRAELPANHGYTSYKIIDVRGKTVRSGRIAGGVTTLQFNNVNSSVMFLKLDGKKGGAPLVLKAVNY